MPGREYLPILDLKPAEMLALEELPNKDKDKLRPLFMLRPWGASKELKNSIARIKKAFGVRRCYLEMSDEEYVAPERRRTVHDELASLRVPLNGYENWVRFFEDREHDQFVPAVQLGGELQNFERQVNSLLALGRGILIRLENPSEQVAIAVSVTMARVARRDADIVVVLDYGKQDARFLDRSREVASTASAVMRSFPGISVAISGSSFPESFVSVSKQEIFERICFNRIASGNLSSLIFSDRGSARVERQLGGGGLPAPRIDYPLKDVWHFFRQEGVPKTQFSGYQAQALRLIESEFWVRGLKLWGCQMIEKTAAGDIEGGISSPNRSTAARINIHLHRQLNYFDERAFFDTDEEWTD